MKRTLRGGGGGGDGGGLTRLQICRICDACMVRRRVHLESECASSVRGRTCVGEGRLDLRVRL